MKNIACMAILAALAGCASAPQPYTDAFNTVKSANTYQYYVARDYRPMEKGESGNCARFAATFQRELAARGVKSTTAACVLKDGTGHAFTLTEDGWVLDNRQRWVVKFADVGCRTF